MEAAVTDAGTSAGAPTALSPGWVRLPRSDRRPERRENLWHRFELFLHRAASNPRCARGQTPAALDQRLDLLFDDPRRCAVAATGYNFL